MANIIEIDRINNVIIMGTTGTTTRFPFLTANRMAYLNGESDITSVSDLTSWVGGTSNQIVSSDDGDGTVTLSTPQDIHTGASPAFSALTLEGTGLVIKPAFNDATIVFDTASRGLNLFLDDSATHDMLHFEGQTASVDTILAIVAQDGEVSDLRLYSGSNFSQLRHTADDHLELVNTNNDKDIVFRIRDDVVQKSIRWDADVDRLKHDSGLFHFDDDNITTTGIGTFGTLVTTGKLTAGSFASPIDVTNTREYGFELHYSGNNYNATAIRARAHAVTTDTSAQFQGGLFQAANNNNINVGVLNGLVAEAIGKATTNAATITMMRGALVGAEWSAKDTVTDLRTLHVRIHTRDAATEGYISSTGYGIYIENEAVGGNGQVLDAGIYFKGTNLSAGNKAYTYGIDFSGATYGTADIKLSDGSVINNTSGQTGLGIASPDGTLHIHTASAGSVTAHTQADDLVIESSGKTGISILTPNDELGSIFFGDPEDNDIGKIYYNHVINELYFITNGSTALSITNAGAVNTRGSFQVDGTQVVGNRVVDARCDDALNSGDATTDGVIDSLRDAMITHGLIAAS